jgi:hypothetical protein
MNSLVISLNQPEADFIFGLLYELPYKYGKNVVKPIEDMLCAKFAKIDTSKNICQTCGTIASELVYPFGSSNTWICIPCMDTISLRIKEEKLVNKSSSQVKELL